MLKIERVYTKPFDMNGSRVLVDRLWARGISKRAAHLNQWAKDMAPSTGLRNWFKHDNVKFQGFMQKYLKEIQHNSHLRLFLSLMKMDLQQGNVILLYGAKNVVHNNAVVMRWYLNRRLRLHQRPDHGLVHLLYNDGQTNQTKRLDPAVQWLSRHPQIVERLRLRVSEGGKIYHNSNRALNHQQLLTLVKSAVSE